jgi:hypothetical protein
VCVRVSADSYACVDARTLTLLSLNPKP